MVETEYVPAVYKYLALVRLFALAAWMEEVTELRDSLLPIMSDVRCQGSTAPGGAPPADT